MEWKCTDPDTNQFGRRISKFIFDFKQDMKYPDGSVIHEELQINVGKYTIDIINEHLDPYGWSLQQLLEETNFDDTLWLIAECIFEQTST